MIPLIAVATIFSALVADVTAAMAKAEAALRKLIVESMTNPPK